jgi:hypothetical protein
VFTEQYFIPFLRLIILITSYRPFKSGEKIRSNYNNWHLEPPQIIIFGFSLPTPPLCASDLIHLFNLITSDIRNGQSPAAFGDTYVTDLKRMNDCQFSCLSRRMLNINLNRDQSNASLKNSNLIQFLPKKWSNESI